MKFKKLIHDSIVCYTKDTGVNFIEFETMKTIVQDSLQREIKSDDVKTIFKLYSIIMKR